MTDGWVAASHRAGPCVGDGRFVWAPRLSRVLLHWGQVCETQSDLRPAREDLIRVGRLAVHQRAHLRDRTVTCVACTRSVVYSEHLVDKVRMELAGAKPFKCHQVQRQDHPAGGAAGGAREGLLPLPHCPQLFPYIYLLQRHPLRHAGEASFPCAECGKSLPRRITLGKHHRRPSAEQPGPCAERTWQERRESHAPEQPFPCAQSGGHFPRRGSLTAHLRARHRTPVPSAASASAASGPTRRTGLRLQGGLGRSPAGARAPEAVQCGKGLRRKDRYMVPLACPQGGQRCRLQLAQHQCLHRAPRELGPTGELGPVPGPATPSTGSPGPGPSPAWAVASPPAK
ncbi:unnamed protein product [Caretta caretta]